MARLNQGTGMWEAFGPNGQALGSFRTHAEAVAAESSNLAKVGGNTDAEFASSTGALATGGSNLRIDRPEVTVGELEALEASRRMRAEQERLKGVPYGTPQSQGGTASQWSVTTQGPSPLFPSTGDSVIARHIDPGTGKPSGPTSTNSNIGLAPQTNGPGTAPGGNPDGALYRPPNDLNEAGTVGPPPLGTGLGIVPPGTAQNFLSPGAAATGPAADRARAEYGADVDRIIAVGQQALASGNQAAGTLAATGASYAGRAAPQMAETGDGRALQSSALGGLASFQPATAGAAGIRGATADTSGADALMRLDSNAPASADRIRGVGADTRGIRALEGFQTSVGGTADALGAFDPRQDAINAVRDFANAPRGPSAAEAQLRDQSNRDMQNALAIARSARGGPAAVAQALRNAQMRQAEISSSTNRAAAILRAEEETAHREQQLRALQSTGQLVSDAEAQRLSALQSQGQLLSQADQQKLSAYQAASAHRLEASQQELQGEVAAGQLLDSADRQRLEATTSAANVRLQGSEINQRGQVAATQAELEGSAQELGALSARGQLSTAIRDADINVLRSNLDASLQTMALNDQQTRAFSQMSEDARQAGLNAAQEAARVGIEAGTAQRALQFEYGRLAWQQLTDIQMADYRDRALAEGIIQAEQDREAQEQDMWMRLGGTLLTAAGMAIG